MDMLGHIPWAVSLAFFLLLVAGYLLYRAALPVPIEGIPYNKYAVRRILGDVPEMVKHRKQTSELFSFMKEQLMKHDSPIVQVFLRPFGKYVSDISMIVRV